MLETVNLTEKLASFDEHYRPKIVAQINDFHVKLAKLEGEFVWHHHDDEDELFFVVAGELTMQLRDQEPVRIGPGELLVVPRGVEHCPLAERETHIMLIEPATTVNTGSAGGERTRAAEWI